MDVTELWLCGLAPLAGEAFTRDAGDLPAVGTAGDEIPPPGESWPQLEDVEAFLVKYADSMRKLHQAVEQGGAARYDLDFGQGFAMPVEHVQRVRSGSRMLCWRLSFAPIEATRTVLQRPSTR